MRAIQVAQSPTRRKSLKGIFLILLIAGASCAAAFLAFDYMGGWSKRGFAGALVLALLPAALYIAIKRPFIFPFTLFVLLVPFDNLLGLNASSSTASGGSYGTVTKLVAIAAGLAFMFWLVRNRRYVPPPKAALLWFALAAWMTLSVVWAINPTAALRELSTYVQLIVLYITISIMPISASEFRAFVGAVIVGSFISALYIVHLYHSGQGLHFNANHMTLRVLVRSGEDKIDPNAFAAALLMPMALVSVWFLRSKWSLTKLVYAGMFLTYLAAVYFSGSRGALVSAGIMMLYLTLRSERKIQMLVFGLLGLGLSFLMPTSPWARFAHAADSGGAGRVSIWKVGLVALKAHWLIGAGVGNFATAYDQSFIRVYQSIYAHWHRAPHDVFLEVAVDLGIIGLCLLLLACYAQWRTLNFIGKSHPLYGYRLAFESALIGLGVDGIFLGILPLKFPWLLFGLMAATRAYALGMASGQRVPQCQQPVILARDGNSQPEPALKVSTHA